MTPSKNPTPDKTAPQSAPAQQTPSGAEPKNKNLNLDLKAVRKKFNQLRKLLSKHATFAAILLVLIVYLFIVAQISHLATAEPSDTANVSQSPQIPKIDKNAVKQIQQLEQSNTQVHSLFNAARNNPFQE